jgi:hypothetical protein
MNAGGQPALRIAKWDGASWSTLGDINGNVLALTVFDDGSGPELVACGSFTSAGGVPASRIARWDGTSWSALGSGLNGFGRALCAFDDGSGPALYAGGEFTTAGGTAANRVARWDGTSWSALGLGTDNKVHALFAYDDSSGPALYAGGEFSSAGGVTARRIARWNGSAWSALGAGTSAAVRGFAAFDDGSGLALYAGGSFASAPEAGDSYLAKWGCPQTLTSTPFCFGDGLDPDVTTACPCANFGAAGHGCGNSVHTGGALLSASGTTAPDAVDLTIVDMPAGVGSIYLQGDVIASAGIVFGDGVRCAAGALERLGLKNDTDFDGSTTLGPGSGDAQISIAGSVNHGATYAYQTYYRNPNAAWCPPATFNVSNGVRIVW